MPNPTRSAVQSGVGSEVLPACEVAILCYPGCQAAMVHGVTDLMTIAGSFSRAAGGPDVRVSHWDRNAAGAIVRHFGTHAATDAPPAVVIVPGRLAEPLDALTAAPFVTWLGDRFAAGSILASICGGTFLLAETGLLDGRPATTHWQFAGEFRARFPAVCLDSDKIVIDDGDIMTAGGLMAWTDLGVHLVDRLLGQQVMLKTAGFFLIDVAGREQRHYSDFRPSYAHGDEAILRVQQWLRRGGAKEVTVADMASHASMEERTFLRRFKSATGMPPSEYAQRLRLDAARTLLQTTKQPVKQVAWSAGYGDVATFGRLFRRMVGLSPGEYRRRFGVAA